MKKFLIPAGIFILFISIFLHGGPVNAYDLPRGDEQYGPRDRQHIFCDPAANPRAIRGDTSINCDTYIPEPTQPSSQPVPSATPRVGDPTGVPSNGPTETPGPSSSSDDDPCAPGKSYSGDYCGWSPRIGGEDGGSSSGGGGSFAPFVQGLSFTGGQNLSVSDIILFLGVLCLLLYVKSKSTVVDRNRSSIS